MLSKQQPNHPVPNFSTSYLVFSPSCHPPRSSVWHENEHEMAAGNREMSALKRKIARGGVGGKQNDESGAAGTAAAAPRKAARRLNLGRAGLYDDKEVPETPQEGVSVEFDRSPSGGFRTVTRL